MTNTNNYKLFRQLTRGSILCAILLVVLGVNFCLSPVGASSTFITFIAVAIIVVGVTNIIAYIQHRIRAHRSGISFREYMTLEYDKGMRDVFGNDLYDQVAVEKPFVNYNIHSSLIYGIASIIIGSLLLAHTVTAIFVLTGMFAAYVILDGICGIINVGYMTKRTRNKILGIFLYGLVLAVGMFFLCHPIAAFCTMNLVTGFTLIASGMTLASIIFCMRKSMKEANAKAYTQAQAEG